MSVSSSHSHHLSTNSQRLKLCTHSRHVVAADKGGLEYTGLAGFKDSDAHGGDKSAVHSRESGYLNYLYNPEESGCGALLLTTASILACYLNLMHTVRVKNIIDQEQGF